MPHAALCVSRHTLHPSHLLTSQFQCRTQHCVCRDSRSSRLFLLLIIVSMPHAALCVSRLGGMIMKIEIINTFQCRTQHCVCRDTKDLLWHMPKVSRFNAARSIVCVETAHEISPFVGGKLFQCRTQHCVCRDMNTNSIAEAFSFQCRTQHCVCRDPIIFVSKAVRKQVSMPHAALCVSRHCVPQPLSRAG